MFLEKTKIATTIIKKNGNISQRLLTWYRFKCDMCEKIYDKKPNNVSKSKSGLHFCSNACKFASFLKGGALRKVSEETAIKNHGVSIPMRSKEIKEKRIKTFQKRYGENVTAALHVPGAKEKRQRTHLERYGVTETFQSKIFREKRIITWIKRYGVPYKPFYETKDAFMQAMMKMPNKWSSNAEIKFCEFLTHFFGKIIRQKHVTKWPIDAYIPSIDVYVQFDGIYWHGLDRDILSIKESIKPRDRAIYNKWLNDREQDAWFFIHKLSLVRITDAEFKINPDACIKRIQLKIGHP